MTTPPGSAGEDQLQNVVTTLLEDRRAMQANIEALMRIVEERTARSGATVEPTERPVVTRGSNEAEVKLQRLTNTDDMEAYLITFERLMSVYEVPQNRWAYRLAPQLTGRAQQAYVAMSTEEAGNYALVKASILRRYDISEETYRQRFRNAVPNDNETYRELAVRTMDLLQKWMKDHNYGDCAKCVRAGCIGATHEYPPPRS